MFVSRYAALTFLRAHTPFQQSFPPLPSFHFHRIPAFVFRIDMFAQGRFEPHDTPILICIVVLFLYPLKPVHLLPDGWIYLLHNPFFRSCTLHQSLVSCIKNQTNSFRLCDKDPSILSA
mmetsp:Transcript_2285/g.4728  ORF Transcript_2285/g.4728 Transcript_2285/m.4728 type:complete len:119 (-) Transcript_2285:9-365(-)